MSVTPEQWRRIEPALEQLLETPSGRRAELLDQLCEGDPGLRAELVSLLSASKHSGGFLETSAASLAAANLIENQEPEPSEQPGATIGRYRLLHEIGRGGMGAVWLAERSDGQYDQQVALKLVKRGMDSDEINARFLRERQILARLEHPNIARLLDGGVSEDGRPYFVMEHVAGQPITEFADARQLPVEERLRLFAIVSRAIGFAHRNLVVHRDIKPSNVMVAEDASIKLLDFGIARLLGAEPDPARSSTARTERLLTPEYASPEQLAGGRVTTASDIYQLGILLYELLTGQRPAERRRPSSAVLRAITATGPDGSVLTLDPGVVSARRGLTLERLHRRLRGDLDVIALRALREEPESRYPSAEDLAEDVERHLAHRPIRFGGDRFSYRAGKFVRRHRLGVAMAAGFLALTLGGVGFDLVRVRRQRDLARHEADKAVEVAQLMARFLQGWNPDASDRGEVSARMLLHDAGLRAERELADRPEMLAATLSILGDFHTTLGEWRTADSLLARALSIQERLAEPSSSDLAASLTRRGRLFRDTGRFPEAAAILGRAIALDRKLFGSRHPETLRARRELASTYRAWKRPAESEALLRAVLADLDEASRNSSPFALEVASELGYALLAQARNDEAIEVLRPALERQRAIFGAVHAATLFTMRSLGSALRDRGELAEAERLYREALRIARALYGNDHPETGGAIFVLALVLERTGNLAEAESLARQSLDLTRRVYGPDNYFVWYGYGHLGAIRLDRGDPVQAERLLREGLARSRTAAPHGDPDQGDLLNRLAYLLVRRGAPDAEVVYREAVAFDDARPPDLPDFVTDGIHFLAWAEHQRGDRVAAEHDYRRALRIYERQLPPTHPYLIAARQGLESLAR
jgi:serine/threonine-protein kinase